MKKDKKIEFYIPFDKFLVVEEIAKNQRFTLAELMRRALDLYIESLSK